LPHRHEQAGLPAANVNNRTTTITTTITTTATKKTTTTTKTAAATTTPWLHHANHNMPIGDMPNASIRLPKLLTSKTRSAMLALQSTSRKCCSSQAAQAGPQDQRGQGAPQQQRPAGKASRHSSSSSSQAQSDAAELTSLVSFNTSHKI